MAQFGVWRRLRAGIGTRRRQVCVLCARCVLCPRGWSSLSHEATSPDTPWVDPQAGGMTFAPFTKAALSGAPLSPAPGVPLSRLSFSCSARG